MRLSQAGFTTRATCLLAAGATAVLCGLIFGEVDLVRAGVLAVAVPIVAAVLVHRSRVRIANRRRVEPPRAEAGQAVTVHLTITNRSALRTSALMLEDVLPDTITGNARFVVDPLAAHEARPVSYRIPALGRGRYRVGPLRMRLSDPFGLIDLSRSFTATSEFLVTPAVDRLPAVEPPRSDDLGDNGGSRSVGAHGADDQSTREYRTGDDLRKIHWRSSARRGALMVRQEERPWQGHSTVLLDLRVSAHASAPAGFDTAEPGSHDPDPRNTDSLEWAISAAASIGTHLLRTGRKLSMIDDPARRERLRFGHAERLRDHLADVDPVTRGDLGPMTDLVRSAARDSALIAVLGRLEPSDVRALADAHAGGRSSPAYGLLLDVGSWSAPLGHDRAAPAVTDARAALDATAATLRAAGWRITVVSRGQTTAQAWELMLSDAMGSAPRAVVPVFPPAAAGIR